jgi:RND family efflux transporter MFP subunit
MMWRSMTVVAALAICGACGGKQDQGTAKTAATPATARDQVTLTPEEQREGGIDVQAAAVSQAPEELRVAGRITLADDRTWRVGIRTDGVVVESFAGVGDFVRKGQRLASYHADEVRDSRALYRRAQAELARAQSAQALAQRSLDRAEKLLELKAGSQVQVDQARQDLATAQSSVRAASVEVDRLKDLLEDDLRVPADADPNDESLDNVPIVAPASGYVLEKNITLGRAIHTTDDTFVIGDLSRVWMLASVRQDQLGALRAGSMATVTVNGMTDTHFTGRVANLGQELDPETRTMQVRIVLENPGQLLRPEMLATAAFPIGGGRSTVFVPSDAVQQVNGQDVVFVRVGSDRFVVRAVRPGTTAAGRTPILDGLKAGEPVVVHGSFVVKSQLLRASLEEGE